MKRVLSEKSKYPKLYLTGWTDDGSRTIDLGQQFEFAVDENGLTATRQSGPWSVDDLFGEMDYWPEKLAWSGSAGTLHELLKRLGEEIGLSSRELLAPIAYELEERRELKIAAYLADEKKASRTSAERRVLWKNWQSLHGNHRIWGIPSPEMWKFCWASFDRRRLKPKDICYSGLELEYSQKGWTARFYTAPEDDIPDLLQFQIWSSDTFDGLFSATDQWNCELSQYLHESRDELARLLIENDPRWRPFIEVDEPKEP